VHVVLACSLTDSFLKSMQAFAWSMCVLMSLSYSFLVKFALLVILTTPQALISMVIFLVKGSVFVWFLFSIVFS